MLSDSLARRPLEFDAIESDDNVLSLMSSMADEYDDIALVVEGTEGARVEGESGGTWPCKEAVGGLMWLVVMSRPDITNAVRAVSRHSNSLAERLRKAVLQIIIRNQGSESYVRMGIGIRDIGIRGCGLRRKG